ncbi:MAG: transposase [Candidatus Delongbacteria bacterium]|nr:transposase [Candidatus Delongbacteria bacterium]
MKKVFHITTAIHNSRYSYRMGVYKIKLNNPIWLTDKDEIIITETIADIIEQDKLNISAYNICGDHIHMVITCEEEELAKIIGKIKAITGRKCNRERGVTEEASTYLQQGDRIPLPSGTGANTKIRHNPFWTQKFGKTEITSEKQLYNTIEYIQNNRLKHKLEDNEGLETLIERIDANSCNASRLNKGIGSPCPI